ncbi:DNA-dependent RNA polymerase i subunit a43 [Phlyctema vagabunda]|uniref:DNA-directed RNA polymerase subunit n=1 Tax=Phlyctema vagabunda TaxID=108571 RepID=A0ABR4PUP7_9HELO
MTSPNESPFHVQTCSLYLPLAPVSQRFPLEGLCAEYISTLILTYYPPFSGVVLSYSNPRMSEVPYGDDGDSILLKSIDEYAVSWAWLTADFLLFKPKKGAELEGYVNLQNEGHLSIVCWNLFNASIERRRLPADWKWVRVDEEAPAEGAKVGEDGIGYYVDGKGKRIEGSIKFRSLSSTERWSDHDETDRGDDEWYNRHIELLQPAVDSPPTSASSCHEGDSGVEDVYPSSEDTYEDIKEQVESQAPIMNPSAARNITTRQRVAPEEKNDHGPGTKESFQPARHARRFQHRGAGGAGREPSESAVKEVQTKQGKPRRQTKEEEASEH